METTDTDPPIHLDGALTADLAKALDDTVHHPHMLQQNRGLRCCYIFYALPEERREQFGSIGRLCRFLQAPHPSPSDSNPEYRSVAEAFDLDFITTDVRADADAPPPPPGKAFRTHRDVTVFFSTREP
jgi:hypothetical protein